MKDVNHSGYFLKAVVQVMFVLMTAAGVVYAGDDDITEIRQGADNLIQTLESMPYASEGAGPAIYTFEFSECPYCQLMHREWSDTIAGVEMRRMFYAVSPRSANEMAALARTRDIKDYKAYMEGRKKAPLVDDKRLPPVEYNKNVAFFNSIMTPLDKVVEPILRQNGVISRNLVSPMLIWQENGRMYAAGGYEKAHFARILERVKAGGSNSSAPAASGSSDLPEEAASTAAAESGKSSAPGVDIVGLRLGMTQEEAVAALRSRNPDFTLNELSLDVTIRDSNRRPFKVTNYVKEVRAGWRPGARESKPDALWHEQIVVVFAPPPAAHRVQYIRRIVRYTPGQGPDFDGVITSIAQKYGEATHIREQGNTLIQLWLYGGKRLGETRFLTWFTKSKIGVDLSQPGTEGGTQIEDSPHLGVYVVPYGHGISMLGAILSESKTTMNARNEATRVMANAALQAHEAKLRRETETRQGADL